MEQNLKATRYVAVSLPRPFSFFFFVCVWNVYFNGLNLVPEAWTHADDCTLTLSFVREAPCDPTIHQRPVIITSQRRLWEVVCVAEGTQILVVTGQHCAIPESGFLRSSQECNKQW